MKKIRPIREELKFKAEMIKLLSTHDLKRARGGNDPGDSENGGCGVNTVQTKHW